MLIRTILSPFNIIGLANITKVTGAYVTEVLLSITDVTIPLFQVPDAVKFLAGYGAAVDYKHIVITMQYKFAKIS